jgi:hypothetical protein
MVTEILQIWKKISKTQIQIAIYKIINMYLLNKKLSRNLEKKISIYFKRLLEKWWTISPIVVREMVRKGDFKTIHFSPEIQFTEIWNLNCRKFNKFTHCSKFRNIKLFFCWFLANFWKKVENLTHIHPTLSTFWQKMWILEPRKPKTSKLWHPLTLKLRKLGS